MDAVELAAEVVVRIPHGHGFGVRAALARQRGGEIYDVAHQIRPGIGGQGGIEAASGMPDQHVGWPHRRDDRIPTIGECGFLIDERPMAGEVDGDSVVAHRLKFGDGALPTPGGVKTAVYEDESH